MDSHDTWAQIASTALLCHADDVDAETLQTGMELCDDLEIMIRHQGAPMPAPFQSQPRELLLFLIDATQESFLQKKQQIETDDDTRSNGPRK